jgi:hypothetical protein
MLTQKKYIAIMDAHHSKDAFDNVVSTTLLETRLKDYKVNVKRIRIIGEKQDKTTKIPVNKMGFLIVLPSEDVNHWISVLLSLAREFNQENILISTEERITSLISTQDKPAKFLGILRNVDKATANKAKMCIYDPEKDTYWLAT